MQAAVSPRVSPATRSPSAIASSSSSTAINFRSFRNNMIQLADRMDRLLVEGAFEVLQRAKALEAQGRSIIHLEIGEPDFQTPQHVIDAGKTALDEGWTHYGPTPGFPDFRQAIASYVSSTRGIPVGAENV